MNIRVMPKDVAFFKTLTLCRAMSTPQIEYAFYSPSTRSLMLYRLKELYRHRFIDRIEQPHLFKEGRRPYIYIPTKNTLDIIADKEHKHPKDLLDELYWNGKPLTVTNQKLNHVLGITDCHISFFKACERHGFFTMEQWLNEIAITRKHLEIRIEWIGERGATNKATLIPDALTTITSDHPSNFYIEYDTGHEWSKREIARKVFIYRQFMQSPDGKTPSPYEQRGKGRILFVTVTPKRLAEIKQITEDGGGRSRFWFVLRDDLLRCDPFGDAIWHKAGDEEMFRLW